ncbi:hypothetical protein DTL21_24450 [Bremerella cremea]|uniref:Glutamine amidotransferase domain-containing protein n=1 Tax=Blastopirellula marina TaxID=124 RepID=A0A2S8FF03_9BACT|nr:MULTISPECIES: hypothetical protein [Pirellulaceae]PQO30504.1 hypothetical protein C5Y83_24405 [Blastopirellula marina]RCS43857.1 hypothetical protein DTL21_24450 [Bremerella cremea]
MFSKVLGWLFGISDVEMVDGVSMSFAAPWATSDPTWLIVGCLAAIGFTVWYYTRIQTGITTLPTAALASVRAIILVLLIVTLADPTIRLTAVRTLKPVLYMVFDGTESMNIRDNLTPDELAALTEAVDNESLNSQASIPELTRQRWVQEYLGKANHNLIDELESQHDIQLEYFLFDGDSTSVARRITSGTQEGPLTPGEIAPELTTHGKVTALGELVNDLGNQSTRRLGGLVVFSDFAHNSGIAPLGSSGPNEPTPLQRLGVPIYTIGIGAISTRDIQIEVQPPLKMKKAERSTITVRLNQSGVQGESAQVNVTARPLQGDSIGEDSGLQEIVVGSQLVTFDSSIQYLEFSFIPQQSGRFLISASVDVLPGEVSEQNNESSRPVNIVDDYIRLTYIENEPTWEWRFVKEVFHRDRLVGMEGFRTFLRSADPKVRQANEMFLPTLTPQRSEFFANDVIFLGDVPSEALNERFCRMLKQFVGQFGGGLVVVSGPNNGPSQLIDTEIADMLPVKLDRSLSLRSARPFPLQITPLGKQADIMQLGDGLTGEPISPWDNLGELPWYQPVLGVHSQANVLAQHPTDVCADGKTPQPIIATRRYGNGEVIYLGFNELWRMRRIYGEKYYRQFWSQIISRLALSHALGSQKRFVLSMDQMEYQVDDRALLTVEAYDENFDPLTADNLPTEGLQAQVFLGEAAAGQPQQVKLSETRPGRFEVRVPVYEAGRYTARVTDPITGSPSEIRFDVVGASAEQRNPARNLALQQAMANSTGGNSYELSEASKLVEDLKLQPVAEEISRSFPIWGTPLWFIVVVALLLTEWIVRKRANLA